MGLELGVLFWYPFLTLGCRFSRQPLKSSKNLHLAAYEGMLQAGKDTGGLFTAAPRTKEERAFSRVQVTVGIRKHGIKSFYTDEFPLLAKEFNGPSSQNSSAKAYQAIDVVKENGAYGLSAAIQSTSNLGHEVYHDLMRELARTSQSSAIDIPHGNRHIV